MAARLARLPALPLNSGFGITIARDADAGAVTESDDLRLYIDLDADTPVRKILDETSASITNGGYTITFSKDSTWAGANLSAGDYECLLFVNGVYDSGCAFEVFTPVGGEANPLTDTATV